MTYIIRDMTSGDLVGSPFTRSPFSWNGDHGECRTKIAHGLELKDEQGNVLQRVYEIEETITGTGSDVSYGDPTYDDVNDRVTRTITKSQTQADIDFEATAYVRNRKAGYMAAVLGAKSYEDFGDAVDGVGFVLDAVIAEMAARGDSETQEFADLLTAIAAVKAAYPKP